MSSSEVEQTPEQCPFCPRYNPFLDSKDKLCEKHQASVDNFAEKVAESINEMGDALVNWVNNAAKNIEKATKELEKQNKKNKRKK